MTARSIALFIAAAIAEIGGAYRVWVGTSVPIVPTSSAQASAWSASG